MHFALLKMELKKNFYDLEWCDEEQQYRVLALSGGGCHDNIGFAKLEEVEAFYHGVVQGRRMQPSTGT